MPLKRRKKLGTFTSQGSRVNRCRRRKCPEDEEFSVSASR